MSEHRSGNPAKKNKVNKTKGKMKTGFPLAKKAVVKGVKGNPKTPPQFLPSAKKKVKVGLPKKRK